MADMAGPGKQRMSDQMRTMKFGTFSGLVLGSVFIVAAVVIVIAVNYGMRQQALVEAQAKARLILDRNYATHTYFSQIMKPSIFAWSEPFRTRDYFDHTWMSSTFAIREIDKFFKAASPSVYYFKDAAINARSPENEADLNERAFIEKLGKSNDLISESAVRTIDGKPYLVVLRRGEVMEESCLRCHSTPENAPKGLTDYYGTERSFNRKAGDMVSAVSLRIPLAEAYAGANIFSVKLSAILLVILAVLFTVQRLFYRTYLLRPLGAIRERARQIAADEVPLSEEFPRSFGKELTELSGTFNDMAVKLGQHRDHLEDLVRSRTEALEASNERYRRVVDTTVEGIWLLDEEFCTTFVSDRLTDLLGYGPDEMIGRSVESFIFDEDMAAHALRAAERRQGLRGTYERRFRRKDGTEIWSIVSASPLMDSEGRFAGSFAMLTDITDRKKMEEDLRKREHLLSKIFDILPVGLWFVDKNGTLLRGNPAGVRIWGAEPAVAISEYGIFKGRRLPSGEEIAPDDWALAHSIREGVTITDELLEIDAFDGRKRVILNYTAPIVDDTGGIEGAIVINLDITDRRRAEEEIRRMNLELEERVARRTGELETKNKELEAFAYSVSHDLRAPLRAIDGFSRILKEEYSRLFDDEGLRLIDVIRTNTGKMDQLIADLLVLSRVAQKELRWSCLDMTSLVRAAYHDNTTAADRSRIRFSLAPLPDAPGDATLMGQVWNNLIANAVKYTRYRDVSRIDVEGRREKDMIVYSVRDNGVGFNRDYAHKLFGVFQRLHKAEEFEGTGVGLAIVQRIVVRHGGKVWAEGETGEGAQFSFSLPAPDQDERKTEQVDENRSREK